MAILVCRERELWWLRGVTRCAVGVLFIEEEEEEEGGGGRSVSWREVRAGRVGANGLQDCGLGLGLGLFFLSGIV